MHAALKPNLQSASAAYKVAAVMGCSKLFIIYSMPPEVFRLGLESMAEKEY